jgi:predicted deacylase
MAKPLLGLLVWLFATTHALALEFSHYHSQDDIDSYLLQMARERPELVHFHHLGRSEQGRPINYLVISRGDPENLPAIFLNGTHHGDERASTETVLGLIDFLILNHQAPLLKELLSSYAIYLQPLVNPDGFALGTRFDARGFDPNRDYAFPGRSDEDSFKTKPIRLVKDLVSSMRFRAALAFHSGMEGVLWAWAHTADRAPDHDLYYTLAKLTAGAMAMPRYVQSYHDYPALGEFIDFVYMNYGTLALTVEVANEPSPPARELAGVVKRAIGGSVAFMLAILELDRGQLRIEHQATSASATWPASIPPAKIATIRGRQGGGASPLSR